MRALAVFGVVWFHFWQQSWISPYFELPFLSALGLSPSVSLDFLPRGGYLFVDWLLFLSAFCLFLPYAHTALSGEPEPDAMSPALAKSVAYLKECYAKAVK